jgi:hypothetical protein
MTGITCALASSGGSKYTGSATVTVGLFVLDDVTFWGYASDLAGSVTPATWASTGANFLQLGWLDIGDKYVTFIVDGVFPNEGWTTLTIGGVSFDRTAASYATDSTTEWIWSSPPPANPFGTTTGATRALVWS